MTERAPLHEFQGWPKTPRLNKQIVVTEKIDGSNAAVMVRPIDPDQDCHEHEVVIERKSVSADGQNLETTGCWAVGAQSRNRLLTPTKTGDNAGFARWVHDNAATLVDLGIGRHFGEWWGAGIQRGYGIEGKRFSLFNPFHFGRAEETPEALKAIGVRTVPLLLQWGQFDSAKVDEVVANLVAEGSVAAVEEGVAFAEAEGVIVRHSASGQVYKRLIENDDKPKSLVTQ